MKTRVSKNVKKHFKDVLNSFVKDLGRSVEVLKKPIKYECFNCYFDKLTNTSTNTCRWTLLETLSNQQAYEDSGGIGIKYKYFSKSRCPVCKGKGFLETIRKQRVDCKINWNPNDVLDLGVSPAGIEDKLLVELKTDPKYYKLFNTCISMKIDDVSCKLFKSPILRGLGNKAILVVIAYVNEVLEEDNSDILKEYTP